MKILKKLIFIMTAVGYFQFALGARLIKNIIKAEDVNQEDVTVIKYERFESPKSSQEKIEAEKTKVREPKVIKDKAPVLAKGIPFSNKELIKAFLMAKKLEMFEAYLDEIYQRQNQIEIKEFIKSKLQESSYLERSLLDKNAALSGFVSSKEKKVSFLYHQLAKKFAGTQPYTDIVLTNASKYRNSLLKGRAISSLSLDALSKHVDKPDVVEGLIRFVKDRNDEQSEMAYQILSKIKSNRYQVSPVGDLDMKTPQSCVLKTILGLTKN